MSLVLSIFDATTSLAIKIYYLDCYDASGLLKHINLWWTISNSKQRYNTNFRIGDAAVEGDNKPLFFQALPIGWKGDKFYNARIHKSLL